MGGANHTEIRTRRDRVRFLLVLILITIIAIPIPAAQAEAIGREISASRVAEKAVDFVESLSGTRLFWRLNTHQEPDPQAEEIESAADRASRVSHIRLCPRRLLLYPEEAFTLTPLAMDGRREAVHGAGFQWTTSNPNVAVVSSWGEVTAVTPGQAIVTAFAGVARANVLVIVESGVRPVQDDLEWDAEHENDCADPESSLVGEAEQLLENPDYALPDRNRIVATAGNSRRLRAAPGMTGKIRRSFLGGKPVRSARPAVGSRSKAGAVTPFGVGDPIDGDSGDTFAFEATTFKNAIGSPRFSPQEVTPFGPSRTKKNLGSYNYLFTAPVLGLGGRGVGVGLAMAYNSRFWNKDGSTITFNYNKGWPAAGWTFGYGRIIKNYDNTASGDQTGVGQSNAPGSRLLIQPDGTRVHLQQLYYSSEGVWKWDTTDGTFIHLARNGKLKYPDGTIVKYDEPNNRLVPSSIRTRNGDLITIAYRTKTSTFKYR